MKLKIVVLTPIPRAMESTATAAKPGCFSRFLMPYRTSLNSVSMVCFPISDSCVGTIPALDPISPIGPVGPSFVPECHQRIDLCRAPRWDIARQSSYQPQQQEDSSKCQR